MPELAKNRIPPRLAVDERKLKKLIRRKTAAWAKIYAAEPDASELVRSLLRGAESIVREHLGLMPPDLRNRFGQGTISRAFNQGRECLATTDLYRTDIFTNRVAHDG